MLFQSVGTWIAVSIFCTTAFCNVVSGTVSPRGVGGVERVGDMVRVGSVGDVGDGAGVEGIGALPVALSMSAVTILP